MLSQKWESSTTCNFLKHERKWKSSSGVCTSSIFILTFSKIRGSSLKTCGRSLPDKCRKCSTLISQKWPCSTTCNFIKYSRKSNSLVYMQIFNIHIDQIVSKIKGFHLITDIPYILYLFSNNGAKLQQERSEYGMRFYHSLKMFTK
jgi:hypothetical protein